MAEAAEGGAGCMKSGCGLSASQLLIRVLFSGRLKKAAGNDRSGAGGRRMRAVACYSSCSRATIALTIAEARDVGQDQDAVEGNSECKSVAEGNEVAAYKLKVSLRGRGKRAGAVQGGVGRCGWGWQEERAC